MADHEYANAASHPPLPELSGRLSNYGFSRRVDILRRHSLAGFIGTGHREINDAFAHVLDHDVTGQSTDGRLASIGERVRRTAPEAESERRVVRAIARVTANHGAYAQQAHRDKRWLRFMRDQVRQSLDASEQYGSLAEYVGATGTLPYEGPGQLVRYVDAARFVLQEPLSDGRYTFSAQVGKDSAGHSVVSDAFTAKTLVPEMEQYQHEVLGGISMNVVLPLLGYAMGNEMRRERFWELDLHEAMRDNVAQPVAAAALESLSA